MKISKLLAAVVGAAAVVAAFGAKAADKVVVGYQTDALPSSVAIADGAFDKATGVKIDFRRFNSG
ncbi:MAG TPA: taurine ABC transporter substrate-binding protein, partial [Roseiarcus sp.]|nr:taurine ABC transporter substrate-binding protein [Roseiarcus sp.]